jgi:hypothetical protein
MRENPEFFNSDFWKQQRERNIGQPPKDLDEEQLTMHRSRIQNQIALSSLPFYGEISLTSHSHTSHSHTSLAGTIRTNDWSLFLPAISIHPSALPRLSEPLLPTTAWLLLRILSW